MGPLKDAVRAYLEYLDANRPIGYRHPFIRAMRDALTDGFDRVFELSVRRHVDWEDFKRNRDLRYGRQTPRDPLLEAIRNALPRVNTIKAPWKDRWHANYN